MSLSRQQPEAPNVITKRDQEPTPDPSQLAHEASTAVQHGHISVATVALETLARFAGVSGLPVSVGAVLGSLASAAVAPAVRAMAWKAQARSAAHNSDHQAAVSAYRKAYELDASPGRLFDLAAALQTAEGPRAAKELLTEGMRRWPDNADIQARAALAALDNAEFDQAEELSAGVLRSDPNHTGALAVQARLRLLYDENDEAIAIARLIVPVEPSIGRGLLAVAMHHAGSLDDDPGIVEAVIANPPADAWVLREFSDALLDVERYAEARDLLDRAMAIAPNDSDVSFARGWANLMLDDYDAAAIDLDRAAQSNSSGMLTALRAEVARLRGEFDTAIRLFRAVPTEETPPWLWFSLGQALSANNDFDAAADAYRQAVEHQPDNVDALISLGEVLIAEHPGEAAGLFHQALSIQPDHAQAYALLGETHRRAERYDDAIREFDHALRVDPEYAYALASKAQALVAQGHVDDGVSALAQAAVWAPESAWILDELVTVLEQHRPDEADTTLKQVQRDVLDRGGNILLVCLRRAELAKRRRLWTEADRLYTKARRLSPDDPNLLYDHVDVIQQLGHLEEAIALLDSHPYLLAAEPDLQWQRINSLWRLERLDEVRSDLEHLAAQENPQPDALAALAETYRMEGDRRRARELLDQAISADSNSSYALAVLGACELQDDEIDAAREHLETSVRLEPGNAFALSMLMRLEGEQGTEERIRELLRDLAEMDSLNTDLQLTRASGNYWLGNYEAAAQITEDCVGESDVDATMLQFRGWLQIMLGHRQRATRSFISAAASARTPVVAFESIRGLINADSWDDAVNLAERTLKENGPWSNPIAMTMWSEVGEWDVAARFATSSLDLLAAIEDRAWLVQRVQRRGGAVNAALVTAQTAHRMWPANVDVNLQYAECLLASGHPIEAESKFHVVVDRLGKSVYLGPYDLSRFGYCMMRTRRYEQAGQVLLRALSVTPEPARVLSDLLLLSLLEDDLRQADVLLHRTITALYEVTPPTRRGTIADALHDLTTLNLTRDAHRKATEISDQLYSLHQELDGVVSRLSQTIPLHPIPTSEDAQNS